MATSVNEKKAADLQKQLSDPKNLKNAAKIREISSELAKCAESRTCDFSGSELSGKKGFGLLVNPDHLPAACGLPRTGDEIEASEWSKQGDFVRFDASKGAQEAHSRLIKLGLRVNFGPVATDPENPDLAGGLQKLVSLLDAFDDGDKADKLWQVILGGAETPVKQGKRSPRS